MQNKQPRNAEGKAHGLWESYYSNGQLCYKGLFLNGLEEGPWESYWSNRKLMYKCNYIKGQEIGYLEWYNLDGSIYQINFYAK